LTEAQNGNIEEAMLAYQAAIAADPNFVDAYINLGAIHFERKEYEQALEMYRKATEKQANNVTAFSNLANVEYKLKRYAEAEGHLKTAVDLAPEDVILYRDLGKVLYAKRDYEGLIKIINKGHELGGGDYLSYYMLGKAYQKLDKDKDATAAYKKSISFKKKNDGAYFALGQINLGQGNYSSAANYFDQALKANPKNYRAAYNHAISVESSDPENYSTNIGVWEKFVKLAKKNPMAHKELAQAENHLKELREAHKQKELQ
jgi:tetratricopeptide (TPR) repeat protein